jgi:hypothetical protein
MLKRIALGLGIICAFTLAAHDSRAACTFNCPEGTPGTRGAGCYNLLGPRWCGSGIRSVAVYNHTGYSAPVTSWHDWNFPPKGPGNAIYLYSNGDSGYDHDVDYLWSYYGVTGWWGLTYVSSRSGCFEHSTVSGQQGWVKMNRTYLEGSATRQILTAWHETGHAIGLDHVCVCTSHDPSVMNPCENCGCRSLSTCDAYGAAHLYP